MKFKAANTRLTTRYDSESIPFIKYDPESFTATGRGKFRPRQTRQLPRAVDLKGRLLSCRSY